jgi:hypothetical protein
MGQMTSKRIGSHRLSSSRRQTGVSLIPALITICIFTLLATQVIIPNQNRNIRETNINAVASSVEQLIQASYAYRSVNNSWPKGFVISSSPTVVTANEILDSTYLPVFNNRTPWGDTWTIDNDTSGFHFKTNTQNQDIARALVQKIGSYAQIAGTVVKVYPVRGASPTVDVQDLTVNQDITVRGNIILTGKIMASDGTTTLFDASSLNHPTSPGTGAERSHYHSSNRFKQNIQPLIPTKSIYQLKPVSFDYKDAFKHYKTPNATNKEIGLIAEQVLPLIPELTLVKDGKVMGVDYQKLSILLLKAIQELRTEVTSLQQNNQQLQKQMDNLSKTGTVEDISAMSSVK